MMTFFSPFVAVALLAQSPAGLTPKGEVVDDQGKPVADAQVVFYSPPTTYGDGDSVEVWATSDAQGKFSMKAPPLKRIVINGVYFFAYRPGWAISAQALMTPAVSVGSGKAQPAHGYGAGRERSADRRSAAGPAADSCLRQGQFRSALVTR